ncbi:MAG: hypothetical protein LBV70_01730 [Candidatus Adiutrix sp.]|jgi:hypothetical protein|nr:hypothetical protein [Candidatus Adiutrix sp.]
MIKPICLILALALAGCSAVPDKYRSRKIAPCQKPAATSLKGVPYQRGSREACAAAVAPFDAGAWHEAPYNSHQVRGQKTVELGCRALASEAEGGGYSGLPGHSQTLMLNFDPSVYPEKALVRRAVLAVYAFENQRGLYEADLRGRLNIGGELQSLARQREAWTGRSRSDKGWVLFDVTSFAARAINERRNSVHFELSRPCLAADRTPVTVGLLDKEPRLLVEFE